MVAPGELPIIVSSLFSFLRILLTHIIISFASQNTMGRPEKTNLEPSLSEPAISNPRKKHKRNLLACDWCHFSHSRCDGTFPCSKCLRLGTRCEITRTRRKRGRIPKRDPVESASSEGEKGTNQVGSLGRDDFMTSVMSGLQSSDSLGGSHLTHDVSASSNVEVLQYLDGMDWPALDIGSKINICDSSTSAASLASYDGSLSTGLESDLLWLGQFNLLDSFHDTYQLPDSGIGTPNTIEDSLTTLRYPVLQPLMPFIRSKISPELACDLLDLYFASALSTRMHPLCNTIPCWMMRKASFLSQKKYRSTRPALLASMLWTASSNDHVLSQPIAADIRPEICEFLGSLTISLLNILSTRHPENLDSMNTSGFSSEDFKNHSIIGSDSGVQGSNFSARSLDDVMTYMHIASIKTAAGKRDSGMHWSVLSFSRWRSIS